jgi:hypothetical protein
VIYIRKDKSNDTFRFWESYSELNFIFAMYQYHNTIEKFNAIRDIWSIRKKKIYVFLHSGLYFANPWTNHWLSCPPCIPFYLCSFSSSSYPPLCFSFCNKIKNPLHIHLSHTGFFGIFAKMPFSLVNGEMITDQDTNLGWSNANAFIYSRKTIIFSIRMPIFHHKLYAALFPHLFPNVSLHSPHLRRPEHIR